MIRLSHLVFMSLYLFYEFPYHLNGMQIVDGSIKNMKRNSNPIICTSRGEMNAKLCIFTASTSKEALGRSAREKRVS